MLLKLNRRCLHSTRSHRKNKVSQIIMIPSPPFNDLLLTLFPISLFSTSIHSVVFEFHDEKYSHHRCKPEEIEPILSPTTATAASACVWEKDWNFSHVDPAIEMILKRNPTSHLYLSGIASSYTGSSGEQAPLFVTFLLPAEFGAPTNSMLLVNNQASEEQVIPFSCLGYRWKLSDDPRHDKRVFYLYCNHDLASISYEEAIRHEYGTLCVVPPSELSTSKNGKLIVDRVRFEFTDPNSDVIDYTWYPREQTFNSCIKDVIECHFKDELEENGLSIEEEMPRIKKYLSKVSTLSRNTTFYVHKCNLLKLS